MFLEHWKRRQISLNYSWDLTGMEEEEVRSHMYIVTLCYLLLTCVCLDSSALAKSWFQWQCFLTLTSWKWLMLTVMWCDTMVASLSDSINVYPHHCMWMSPCGLSQKWTHQYVNLLFLYAIFPARKKRRFEFYVWNSLLAALWDVESLCPCVALDFWPVWMVWNSLSAAVHWVLQGVESNCLFVLFSLGTSQTQIRYDSPSEEAEEEEK